MGVSRVSASWSVVGMYAGVDDTSVGGETDFWGSIRQNTVFDNGKKAGSSPVQRHTHTHRERERHTHTNDENKIGTAQNTKSTA